MIIFVSFINGVILPNQKISDSIHLWIIETVILISWLQIWLRQYLSFRHLPYIFHDIFSSYQNWSLYIFSIYFFTLSVSSQHSKMYKSTLVFLFIFSSSVLCSINDETSNFIVGGEKAREGQFPHTVSLRIIEPMGVVEVF